MSEIPNQSSVSEALKIFMHAQSFQLTATLIDKHQQTPGVDPGVQNALAMPMMANEVFALELFMKCLLRLRGAVPRVHEADALFEILSEEDQSWIRTHYSRVIAAAHPATGPTSAEAVARELDQILQRSNELYSKMRRWHEVNPLNVDHDSHATNARIGLLADAIKNYLCDLQPDWRGVSSSFR